MIVINLIHVEVILGMTRFLLNTNKINKPNSSVTSDLMNIQRAIGNRAVGNMLTIQTKMTVGPVGDAYEQEADQMGKQAAEHIAASESSGASKQMFSARKVESLRKKSCR